MTEHALPTQGDSALETAQSLKDCGWSTDFEISEDGIRGLSGSGTASPPGDFGVRRTYRFEGKSNPDDEVILLAVEHLPTGERGVIHAAFGPDATAAEASVFRELAGPHD